MRQRVWVAAGAVLAALAVFFGAFGAHILKEHLDAERLTTFEVGVRYHMFHALGLILVGILAERWTSRAVTVAALLLLCGIILFSGGLYVWTLAGVRAAVSVVPLGGLSFMAGWVALGVAAARR